MKPVPPVDFDQLHLLTLGDEEVCRQVVRSFLARLPEYRKELPRAAADPQEFAFLLHRLKGASLAVAARPLARRIARIEQLPGASAAQRRAAAGEVLLELAAVERALSGKGGAR
ncbi:MAG: Hpt domain-containing protein [Burkholderiales bacterium]|nr:Hpt domain-containing protein [Burkholderiales bacterium]